MGAGPKPVLCEDAHPQGTINNVAVRLFFCNNYPFALWESYILMTLPRCRGMNFDLWMHEEFVRLLGK